MSNDSDKNLPAVIDNDNDKNLPAVIEDDEDDSLTEKQRKKYEKKRRKLDKWFEKHEKKADQALETIRAIPTKKQARFEKQLQEKLKTANHENLNITINKRKLTIEIDLDHDGIVAAAKRGRRFTGRDRITLATSGGETGVPGLDNHFLKIVLQKKAE